MPAPSIRTLSRRFDLLKAREQSLLGFWDVAGPFHSDEDLNDALVAHSDVEAEYLGSYVNMLIDLLAFMSAGDPDHVARLGRARQEFFMVMAQQEESDRKPRAVHWFNILAWALAGALPDDVLSPDDFPSGRWAEPLRQLIERRDQIDADYDRGLRMDRYDREVYG
jgi:hypothetical protein